VPRLHVDLVVGPLELLQQEVASDSSLLLLFVDS
jgi:hypothetical protein